MPNIQTVTTSGVYRIHAQDIATPTGIQALKIQKDNTRNYWIEFRRKLVNYPTAGNGAIIHWGYNSGVVSNVLDMTPGSAAGADDSPLVIGQTFTDSQTAIPISITPIAKGGSNPEWLDVKVRFGPNRLPVAASANVSTPEDKATTVTLAGTDEDTFDTLSYKITALPTHGTLSSDSDGNGPNSPQTITTAQLPYILPASGNVIYTPATHYNGNDAFKFRANDGTADSNEATISLTVSSVNDAPVLDNSGDMSLTTIDEDSVSHSGTRIKDIIRSAK
jgi:hypothetical protein